jgi:RND family efflux transporter MFP subunit
MKRKASVLALMLSLAGGAAIAGSTAPLAPIMLSPERRQLIGLKTAMVEEKEMVARIDATGTVEPDERLESVVQTRFAGWVRRVFVNQTYQEVRRGEPLFTIYSPELLNTENEYLIALDAERRMEASPMEEVARNAASLRDAALDRLRLLGVPESEIERLVLERTAHETVDIESPVSGVVVERNALPNQYVQPETRLYSITKLSDVWVYAAVFQDDIGRLKTGDPVKVTVDTYPGREFGGRVDFIWPAIDPATRTGRVRCVLDNREGLLKLGMYAKAAIMPHRGRGLVIPDTGVLRTGAHDVVFVDRGGGYLNPVEVVLGPHLGREYQVLKGLRAGERIVASANFLVDSESQLQAATASFVPPAEAAARRQQALQEYEITLATEPRPPVRGTNRLVVSLKDPGGKPLTGARVSVSFYMAPMPAMGMAAMRERADLSERGGGIYEGKVDLPSGGSWQVSIAASIGERTIAARQYELSVSGSMAM